MNKVYLSIVIPVFGCKECLNELNGRLIRTLETISPSFELIYIIDGNIDNSWETVLQLSSLDSRIKGINLSRNFGQHYAISAGLNYSVGEWVVVMDCDLQDQPEEILKLHTKAKEGYDIVYGRRQFRKDSYFKRKASQLFYKILSYLTETEQNSLVGNFGIYHSKVIMAINSMQDEQRYFPTMVKWVGFKQVAININHSERAQSKSSYSYLKLFKLALDVMLAFSNKPLRLIVQMGLIISFSSVCFAVYNIWKYLNGEIMVSGWTSLIFSIWFLSGIIILILGTVGLYIGKIFEKVKNRPLYIIDKTCNIQQ